MSNPTMSIRSRRRFRLTKIRFLRGMSSDRAADSLSSRSTGAPSTTSALDIALEGYHGRSGSPASPTPFNRDRFDPVIVALGQINPTIGDFDGNRRLITAAHAEAAKRGADLLVVSELALSGYPPKDLLERPAFLDAARAALDALARATAPRGAGPGTAILVGFPEPVDGSRAGRRVANSAALIEDGAVTAIVRKSLLPTYDVFDEWRYFEPASEITVTPFRGRRLGVSICEDIWN